MQAVKRGTLGRIGLVAAAATALALAAGRLLGANSVTAAEAPTRSAHLQSSATESLRVTLRHAGLSVADANGAAFALADLLDPEHPPPGLDFELKMERADTLEGVRLIELAVSRQGRTAGRLTRAADGSWHFTKGEDLPPPTPTTGAAHEDTAVLQGSIEDVLYGEASSTADATIQLKAARLFAARLDMTRDIDLGDTVRLVFTRQFGGDGRVLRAGDLLYAEIDTRQGATRVYRHRRAGGQVEFVDDQGAALEHALLRTPVEKPRITSDFGMRLHPLLGYTRMHQGVDFGAPVGSAVLAAADGVVEDLHWAGGYGRWIKLRHTAGLETGYGHLSAWAPGLRPGESVRQGQVIGYVGSSGLSTGPHLHYEVLEGGRPVDPTTVQATTPAVLSGAERVAFESEKQRVTQLLQAAPAQRFAAQDLTVGGTN
jgi:murein DD-endopeptidase MepM/ murein hydrolase activator NlpD